MIEIITTPPPQWDELSKNFNVKWEGYVVLTYGGKIYCPTGIIAPDVLVHELVHVEQQKGKDMRELLQRYMTDIEFLKSVEIPAFKAQAAFLDATLPEAEAWCKKRQIAKVMVSMYKGAFTMETASGIMNL